MKNSKVNKTFRAFLIVLAGLVSVGSMTTTSYAASRGLAVELPECALCGDTLADVELQAPCSTCKDYMLCNE